MGVSKDEIKEKIKRKRKINDREKLFVKEYITNGMSKKKAALAVYNVKPDNAKSLGHQVLDRQHVREYLEVLLKKNGLDLPDVMVKITKSLDYNMEDGKPSQSVVVALLDMLLKLHSAYPAVQTVNANVNISKTVASTDYTDVTSMKKSLQNIQKSITDVLVELDK